MLGPLQRRDVAAVVPETVSQTTSLIVGAGPSVGCANPPPCSPAPSAVRHDSRSITRSPSAAARKCRHQQPASRALRNAATVEVQQEAASENAIPVCSRTKLRASNCSCMPTIQRTRPAAPAAVFVNAAWAASRTFVDEPAPGSRRRRSSGARFVGLVRASRLPLCRNRVAADARGPVVPRASRRAWPAAVWNRRARAARGPVDEVVYPLSAVNAWSFFWELSARCQACVV